MGCCLQELSDKLFALRLAWMSRAEVLGFSLVVVWSYGKPASPPSAPSGISFFASLISPYTEFGVPVLESSSPCHPHPQDFHGHIPLMLSLTGNGKFYISCSHDLIFNIILVH